MSEKKLAKVYYADLYGFRREKYKYLFKKNVRKTRWKKLTPVEPYYFFVPKDFALKREYENFWKLTDIFKEWSSGVKTHRDHFVVGFTKEEVLQRLRIFSGNLSNDFVKKSLSLKETSKWNINEARKNIKDENLEKEIYLYTYRPYDYRWICYESKLIDRKKWPFMDNLIKNNISLVTTRILSIPPFRHSFVTNCLPDICLISIKTKETSYFFPLYLYTYKQKGHMFKEEITKDDYISNLSNKFLHFLKKAIKEEFTLESIFYYIYSVLSSPIYRKRYEEFLKIDFPRIPLPYNYNFFKSLSELGKELVDLHLLKHSDLSSTEIGFPIEGSNVVEKINYNKENRRVFINKTQYFEGVNNGIWEYRIGSYQVMEKYLKDRKGRKLSLDEINHYMKIAKSISMTIEIQRKIDKIYSQYLD